jgi:hypothetical protein
MGMTMSQLHALCLTPDSRRDYAWERKFLDTFVQGRVSFISEQPQQGPDGWPYLFVKTSPDENSGEPVIKILSWLKDKGIGLVVNPNKELPDFIFTYGMIWNFAERGLLIDNQKTSEKLPTVEFAAGEKFFIGAPSNELLPVYVSKIIKEFLEKQGVMKPRVAVISRTNGDYDLAFSLESLGSPPSAEHRGILEAFSWFLPTTYSLTILPEKEFKPFYDLADRT